MDLIIFADKVKMFPIMENEIFDKDENLDVAPSVEQPQEEQPQQEQAPAQEEKPQESKKQRGGRLVPAIVFLVLASISLIIALVSLPYDLALMLANFEAENIGEAIGGIFVMIIIIMIMIIAIANSIIDIPLAIANTLVCLKSKRKATRILMWITDGFFSASITIGLVKLIELLIQMGQ